MTEPVQYVEVEGGRLAYEVTGAGPLVVLSPGMADTRHSYRFLAPLIAAAGFRVASVDLRGHGESTTGWPSYTHEDTASDLLAVVDALGGPAVIVGQSFSGGATTIAAATHPDQVSAIVEIDPFTRPPTYSLSAFLRNRPYRHGALLLGRFALTGSVRAWARYLHLAYPEQRPSDWEPWLTALQANLGEPGRAKAAQKMVGSSATLRRAASLLSEVRSPALVIMGTADSDFPDPEAEAAAIVALLPEGLGTFAMIEGAGHYPHAEFPRETAEVVLAFLADHVHA